jgi:DNA-directed RNA polymerase subunit K/omega
MPKKNYSEDEVSEIESEASEPISDVDDLPGDSEHLDRDTEDAPAEGEASEDYDEEYDPVTEDNLVTEDEEEGTEEENDEETDLEMEDEKKKEEKECLSYEEVKVCHSKDLRKMSVRENPSFYENLEYKKIPDNERITDPIMTYYEIVRILGVRTQQLNRGAPPFIDNTEELTNPQIAYLELISKMVPYIIRRYLPGKLYEDVSVKELEIIHQIHDPYYVPENFDYDNFIKQVKKKK